MKFRSLTASEVECRVAMAKANGVSLLLYKDARCDMNILDETVGAENWQRSHEVINGSLFCNVGIKVDRDNGFGEWVWKQDVGTESNTEKEKGQASDAFKRACFNWGIGRELYTAPFIWINAGDAEIRPKGQGYACYDRFDVTEMDVSGGRITALTICKNGKTVFEYPKKRKEGIGEAHASALRAALEKRGMSDKGICSYYKVGSLNEFTLEQFKDAMNRMGENEG